MRRHRYGRYLSACRLTDDVSLRELAWLLSDLATRIKGDTVTLSPSILWQCERGRIKPMHDARSAAIAKVLPSCDYAKMVSLALKFQLALERKGISFRVWAEGNGPPSER